jgi:predicted PhzF superfamily epimerase YddE/YHI9
MLHIPIYHIDTFTSEIFKGNPAAVCPLQRWLPDDVMQQIAMENNLSETAFFVPLQEGFEIRWFTPTTEVDLCGHATLASAFVLFTCLDYQQEQVLFQSKSGILSVRKDDAWLLLDFPLQAPVPCDVPSALSEAWDGSIIECLKSEDYIVLLEDEDAVKHARPNLELLKQLDLRGVIITAQSHTYDFVSRFFAPHCGIDEDPVTGSAYTQLAPFWSARLGKAKLHAKQISARGGEVLCEVVGERVHIAGKAVKFSQGEIAWQGVESR